MDSDSWFYTLDKHRNGPVTLAELKQLVAGGTVAPDTRVWRPEAEAWLPAAQVPELVDTLRGPRPAASGHGASAWPASDNPDAGAGAAREAPSLPATPGDLRKLSYAFEHSGAAGAPRPAPARPIIATARPVTRGRLKWLAGLIAVAALGGGARALVRARLGDPLRALPPAARAALDSAPAPRRQALEAGYRELSAMTRTPAFQARFHDVPRDSAYAAGARAATQGMKRLGPEDLGSYAGLMATIFQRTPRAPWCVPMLGTGTFDQGLATRAILTLDSADIRLWFQLSRLALEAELAARPASPAPGQAEKQAAWNAMLDGMPTLTRSRFVAQAQAPIHDPDAACWQGAVLFGAIAALPAEQGATILRGSLLEE